MPQMGQHHSWLFQTLLKKRTSLQYNMNYNQHTSSLILMHVPPGLPVLHHSRFTVRPAVIAMLSASLE